MTIKNFLLHCEIEKKLSGKNIKAYISDLSQFLIHVSQTFEISDCKLIHKEHLKDYFQELKKYAPKTVRRKMATFNN